MQLRLCKNKAREQGSAPESILLIVSGQMQIYVGLFRTAKLLQQHPTVGCDFTALTPFLS